MPYCSSAELAQILVNITIDATSKPSTADVTEYINQISAEMDSVFLGASIVLPIADAGKLLTLKRIALNGVAAMVLRATGLEPEQAMTFQKLYDDALERIQNNPSEISSTVAAYQAVTGYKSGADRHFTREDDQW